MCGIIGFYDQKISSEKKIDYISSMMDSINHRGPDSEGYFNDKFVSFAFNRLSIMDLKKGNQPIVRENIISIFNGEIYNFKEIRAELIKFGYKFETNSDSEIIAPAFLHWGIKSIEKFNGMFAIAIYDKKNNKVFLIRDRVGIKPLYLSYINSLAVKHVVLTKLR